MILNGKTYIIFPRGQAHKAIAAKNEGKNVLMTVPCCMCRQDMLLESKYWGKVVECDAHLPKKEGK